jgi:hypothetical protein
VTKVNPGDAPTREAVTKAIGKAPVQLPQDPSSTQVEDILLAISAVDKAHRAYCQKLEKRAARKRKIADAFGEK